MKEKGSTKLNITSGRLSSVSWFLDWTTLVGESSMDWLEELYQQYKGPHLGRLD